MIGEQMAGPGIRYWNFARVLSREFAVTLVVPHPVSPATHAPFRMVAYTPGDWNSLEPLVQSARVIILPGILVGAYPQLGACAKPIAIDGYDPYLVEWLATYQANQQATWASFTAGLTWQCLVGDFFVCASERQRDWWLGLLEAHGRVNPWTFAEDASLRHLVDVVPFGLASEPPTHTRNVIKGVRPGIGATDRVILWGGGLWPWLDPLTAIRAVAQVHQHHPEVRLVFPGTRHPNPALATMPTLFDAANELAKQLDVLDRIVFFGDWVAYADWQNILLESDLALTLHASETVEARLAFRSRVLDYIWAGVPIVASQGDATSELIAQNRLGELVACGDVPGVARAINNLLNMPRADFAERFAQTRMMLTWERVLQPLVEFCRAPRIAPDKAVMGDHLGNALHVERIAQVQAELARLHGMIQAYEQRRSIKLARALRRIRPHQG